MKVFPILAALIGWVLIVVGETPGGAFAGVNTGPSLVAELPNSTIP